MPPLRSAVAEPPAHRRHQHIRDCHSHSSQESNLMDRTLHFPPLSGWNTWASQVALLLPASLRRITRDTGKIVAKAWDGLSLMLTA